MNIQDTLDEREKQHGSFVTHAAIEHGLRSIAGQHGNALDDLQYIGLGMILHKIARILNDGHNHTDSWHDIAGYAILVEQEMQCREDKAAKTKSKEAEFLRELENE